MRLHHYRHSASHHQQPRYYSFVLCPSVSLCLLLLCSSSSVKRQACPTHSAPLQCRNEGGKGTAGIVNHNQSTNGSGSVLLGAPFFFIILLFGCMPQQHSFIVAVPFPFLGSGRKHSWQPRRGGKGCSEGGGSNECSC